MQGLTRHLKLHLLHLQALWGAFLGLTGTGWCSRSGRLEGCRKMWCDMSCRTFLLAVKKGGMESQDMYAGNEDTVGDAAFLGEARSAELQWFASVLLHAAS